MDEGLDEETAAKYEEIRAIASKNWLNSASVSLAKLDQVRAKVYNVGLEIKPVAGKGNASSQGASACGSQTTVQLDPDPPLTNVMSQRTAWGSNTSIPDLIRQQSERQRPESASVNRRVRPPSGRRTRPQSAKEPGNAAGKPPPGIAIKGAKFDPSSRPPKSNPSQNVTTGWVGTPAGIVYDPNIPEDNSVQKYARQKGRQVAKLSMAYAGDLTEPWNPPPPAGSPDIIDMINDAQGNNDDLYSDDSFFSGDEKPMKYRPKSGGRPPRPSSGKKKNKRKKEKLLRRPTPEPIHFSLPTADMDESADLDTDRLIGSVDRSQGSPVPFQSKPGFSYIHADINGQLSQDGRPLSEKVTPTPGQKEVNFADDFENDDVILDLIEDDEGADTDDAGIDAGIDDEPRNVQFDEANNITVDITPRNRGRPASGSAAKSSNKGFTGRADLRYVKSRIDSGVSLSSVPSASVRRTGSGFDLTGRSDSRAGSNTGRVRSLVSRTRSTGKMKIPTVSVAYKDENDADGQKKGSKDAEEKKGESESMKRAREGLITMVSQITENEPGRKSEEDPMARPGSATKYFSERARNYYKDAIGVKDEKKVTTKTLTLTGNDVTETKLIRTIDAHENKCKEYQVPDENKPPKRTTVSQKPRPASSQVVHLKPEEPKVEASKRPKSASAASYSYTVAKTDQDLSTENKPATAVKTAFVNKPSPRPESANKASGAVHKNGIKVSDAFKAIRESSITPRVANQDRVYASYARAKSAPVKSKRKPAVEVEPVYIFTRKEEVDWDTPEVQKCKEMHERLKEKGVNVTVDTLKRALLPPMDNSYYITPCDKPPLPDSSSGLLSSPAVWLASEFQRLKLANKAVERANERLFMQKQAEQRAAMRDRPHTAVAATASAKKKKKGKGKKKPKRVQSAGLLKT